MKRSPFLTARLIPLPVPAIATPGYPAKPDYLGFDAARQLFFSQEGGGNPGEESPIIEVERRREDDSSGERERAEAPHRRTSDESGGEPSQPPSDAGNQARSGSDAASSSGSSFDNVGALGGVDAPSPGGGWGGSSAPPAPSALPGGGGAGGVGTPRISMMGLLLLLVLCAGAYFFSRGSGGSTDNSNQNSVNPPVSTLPTPTRPTSASAPTALPRPTRSTVDGGSTQEQNWLVMLYQDADDSVLEQDIYVDLNEAERVGSNDQVKIVAQLDRFKSGFSGDGNWTSARRYYITKDNDLSNLHSQQMADLGEVDMSDPATLVDFATWAIQNYPADKYVLILSDHGMGWPGGWVDPTGDGRNVPDAPLAQAVGNQMFLSDIDNALGQIRQNTGVDKFELVGLDACLMSQLEVFDVLAQHARYAVASQETEPSLGFAYTSFLRSLEANPSMSGGDLAADIVKSYITDDQRIVDDQARSEFVRGGPVTGGLFGGGPTADQVSQQLSRDVTLTAADLSAVPETMNAVNDLAYTFQEVDQRPVAQARQYAQSFTNVFGDTTPPPYIDLGNFVQLLKQMGPRGNIATALDGVEAAIGKLVIQEKHGPNKPGASGVSIYFPNSQLYRSPVSGPQSYTKIANRFASDSVWDNFLAYHYTGKAFDKAPDIVAVPDRNQAITAPAVGVQVSVLKVSSKEVAPGQTLTMSADVTGKNVGYIKLFAGYFDTASNSINVVDTDFLQSPNTRQVDGVYYPDWGDGSKFTVQFKWEPVVFGITDGTKTVTALLNPQTYGAQQKDAVYTVDGMYTDAAGGPRYARLYFRDGTLQSVFVFTGKNGTGAPREVTPQKGDKFTILERWIDLDANGKVKGVASQEGSSLTFGDQTFKWKSLDAAAGPYVVGFIVEDIDGNPYPTYAPVTVK